MCVALCFLVYMQVEHIYINLIFLYKQNWLTHLGHVHCIWAKTLEYVFLTACDQDNNQYQALVHLAAKNFHLTKPKMLSVFGPHVVTAFLDGLKDGNPFVGNGFVRSTTLLAIYDKSHEAGVAPCMEATYCWKGEHCMPW